MMKRTCVAIIALALLPLFFTGCSSRPAVKPAPPGKTVRIIRHSDLPIKLDVKTRNREIGRFLVLINRYRAGKGLKPLTLDKKLQKAAQWMSEDMAAHDYLEHYDSKGRDPFVRMAAFGYNYNTYKAENVAAGQQTAAKVMQSWQNSKTHNVNMLNPNFTVIGIGFAYGKKSRFGWYWTTTFGGRKSR